MKKLIISSDVLRPALSRLSYAVSKKSIIPALTSIHCSVTEGNLALTASDIELTITAQLACETKKSDGEFLIPFKFFNDTIDVIGSVPVVIEYDAKKVVIHGDNDTYESPLFKASDYPTIPTLPKKNSLKMEMDFVSLLQDAFQTASKDDLRPALTCACLDLKAERPALVSTDAFSLYRMELEITKPDAIQLLFSRNMTGAVKGLHDVEISWTEKHIGLKSGNITVIAKRVDAAFPNYKVIIPKCEPNLIVDRANLLNALNKSTVVNDGAMRTVLQLTKEPGKIIFDSIDADSEQKANVSIPCTYTGTVDSVTINARKLTTSLKQIEAETVRLHISSPKTAILISAEDNQNFLGLVMPIVDKEK